MYRFHGSLRRTGDGRPLHRSRRRAGAGDDLLWNALIPTLFNGPSLTFGQALGLLILSHILLRGASPWRYGGGWHRERWRRRFEEKLQAMTPEERERFKREWGRRCGWSPAPAPEQKPAP